MAGRPSLPGGGGEGCLALGRARAQVPRPPFRTRGTSCARASSDRHRSLPIVHRISMISDKSDHSCYRIFVNPQPDKGSFYYFFFVFC